MLEENKKEEKEEKEETIRILRILEYSGPRSFIEHTLLRSKVQGTLEFKNGAKIRGAIIGAFPEVMEINSDSEQWIKS